MPTYRNDAELTTYTVMNSDGKKQAVRPGFSIMTRELLTGSDWTKLSDAPYWNPALVVTQPSGSGNSTLTLQADTKEVEVVNVSNVTVTVYYMSTSNTPGLIIPSNMARTIKSLKDRSTVLVFTFSGSVTAGDVIITELRG